MFDDCFLSFREKATLFFFQFKPWKKSRAKKLKAYNSLLFEYEFLEEFLSDSSAPVVRISYLGKKYLRYRREKRHDSLILPVLVSVAASIIVAFISTRLI